MIGLVLRSIFEAVFKKEASAKDSTADNTDQVEPRKVDTSSIEESLSPKLKATRKNKSCRYIWYGLSLEEDAALTLYELNTLCDAGLDKLKGIDIYPAETDQALVALYCADFTNDVINKVFQRKAFISMMSLRASDQIEVGLVLSGVRSGKVKRSPPRYERRPRNGEVVVKFIGDQFEVFVFFRHRLWLIKNDISASILYWLGLTEELSQKHEDKSYAHSSEAPYGDTEAGGAQSKESDSGKGSGLLFDEVPLDESYVEQPSAVDDLPEPHEEQLSAVEDHNGSTEEQPSEAEVLSEDEIVSLESAAFKDNGTPDVGGTDAEFDSGQSIKDSSALAGVDEARVLSALADIGADVSESTGEVKGKPEFAEDVGASDDALSSGEDLDEDLDEDSVLAVLTDIDEASVLSALADIGADVSESTGEVKVKSELAENVAASDEAHVTDIHGLSASSVDARSSGETNNETHGEDAVLAALTDIDGLNTVADENVLASSQAEGMSPPESENISQETEGEAWYLNDGIIEKESVVSSLSSSGGEDFPVYDESVLVGGILEDEEGEEDEDEDER